MSVAAAILRPRTLAARSPAVVVYLGHLPRLALKTHQAALVAEVRMDPKKPETTRSALRVARNNLAHGTRGYDPAALDETVSLLEQVVRAHALRLLGCPDEVLARVLKDPLP